MSRRPLVSIAVATYNGERYLREQLDTVYAQTWEPLEVVVSDDASTDGTAGILAEYAAARGLRYAVNPVRLGLTANFERAISLCRGELVALCDQDDLWKPHKIAALAESIGGASLVYCNGQEHLATDGSVRVDHSVAHVFAFARTLGARPTRHLLAENWVVSHTLMFRREICEHALPIPPHHVYHDGWLALVASKLGGIRYLDQMLQTHRRHAASITFMRPEDRPRGATVRGVVNGSYRAAWESRCAAEIARLEDALSLPLLDAVDRAFAGELMSCYRGGLSWRVLRSGWRVAPYFSSLHGEPRWKMPLRALAGGLPPCAS